MKRITVWFSCGVASACAAHMTQRLYGKTHIIKVVNSPIAEEDEDNARFLHDVEGWLGVKIETAVNPRWPSASAVAVWEKERFMSGPYGAPCTRALKKEARYAWEKENPYDFMVLGFTKGEEKRHARFIRSERENVIPVLIDAGMTKADCAQMIADVGIAAPRVYSWGMPNANCIGCAKSTNPQYWNLVRRVAPGVFAQRAEQSRALGCRLVEVSKKRIYLDELDPEEKRGRRVKSYHIECGIFCEPEKTK